MKTLFNLQGEAATEQELLLLELGADQLKFGFYGPEKNRFSHIRIYETDEINAGNSFNEIFRELGNRNLSKVVACSSYPQAFLLPRFKTGDHAQLWKTIYHEPVKHVFKDDIPEWQTASIYSIPLQVQEELSKAFPGIQYMHNFSCALRNYNGYDSEDQLSIDFSTRYFRVIVKKEGRLQLAQIYSYTKPLDVVYYLLKINSEIGLDQAKVLLVVSGLIEKNSAMYQLLNDYFANIAFAKSGNATIPDTELPAHFFTSLNNLAACAS